MAKEDKKFKKIPIFYLTELMALALGIDIPNEVWDEHVIDPRAFLETKGYILATKK